MKKFKEPVAQKAGDKRVLVNGYPLTVDFRIITEDNYQVLMDRIKQLERLLCNALHNSNISENLPNQR